MPLTASEKRELVARYQEGLASASHVFVLGFKGIDVPQATELRNKVREAGGSYIVVKNRLALRVIEDGALAGLREHFRGPTAVAWSEEDPVGLAKALSTFAKEVTVLEFKAGLVDGSVVAGEQVTAIAALPSREELIAKLVFLLQAPISRFVRVLGALPRGMVTVLDQIAKKRD